MKGLAKGLTPVAVRVWLRCRDKSERNLLGTNPRLRIIVTAYNDPFAEHLCGEIRDMMQTPFYHRAFATRIKEGHSRANDFATREGGGVFAVAATGSITGRTADFIIYDDPHEIGGWNN